MMAKAHFSKFEAMVPALRARFGAPFVLRHEFQNPVSTLRSRALGILHSFVDHLLLFNRLVEVTYTNNHFILGEEAVQDPWLSSQAYEFPAVPQFAHIGGGRRQ
jgi:hypothetical protein